METVRFLLAATVVGCTSIPQAPTTSAVSADASAPPLPTVAVALRSEAEDAATKGPEEQPHHHRGGDHGDH
jgi:hypothetical protein